MSKKFSREDKEIDRLYNENREQKKEIRRLQKLVKKLNKGYKRLVEDDIIEEETVPEEVKKLCFDCSGEYKEIIILNRRWRQCLECGKRGKVSYI